MENGIYPEYENSGLSFYHKTNRLEEALNTYAIRSVFKNRNGTD